MLAWTFICKSAYVKYNLMYVLNVILCTDLDAVAITEISW